MFDVPNFKWLEGLRDMNEDYLSLGIELRFRCRLVDLLPDLPPYSLCLLGGVG